MVIGGVAIVRKSIGVIRRGIIVGRCVLSGWFLVFVDTGTGLGFGSDVAGLGMACRHCHVWASRVDDHPARFPAKYHGELC